MPTTPQERHILRQLGQRILACREARSLTMQDVQALCGVSPTMQSHIEQGQLKSGPRILHLMRIAMALKLPLDMVLMEMLQQVADHCETHGSIS